MTISQRRVPLLLCAVAMVLAACGGTAESDIPCLRYELRTVETQPNMGLIGMGPAFAGVALQTVREQQKVCVLRALPSQTPSHR
jgi:hypothetical protein